MAGFYRFFDSGNELCVIVSISKYATNIFSETAYLSGFFVYENLFVAFSTFIIQV